MHCSWLAVCLRATRIFVLVAGTSAFFLEMHPSEEAIIIDTCRDPEEGDRAPDRTLLEVAELHFDSVATTPTREEEPTGPEGTRGAGAAKAPLPGGRELRFSHGDGFAGQVHLEAAGGRLVPAGVRTPLLFRTASLRAAMGDVPHHKTVTFTGWKPRLGRVVPHSIAFDEGIEPRRRRLLDLERVPETPAERFQPPGTRP